MADLIKKLIDKKRRDAKFKSAGPGHKLNEEKPKTQTLPSTSSQRYEPCAEARQAGMAALARCSGSNSHGIPGFSLSAMKLVPTKNSLMEQQISSKEANEMEGDAPIMAVHGIYYKCPLIGNDILTKQEWQEKIKKYLYDQLAEERGLTACLIIYNCNKNKEKVAQCVSTLQTYISNLISYPDQEKYQKIRMNNKLFQEKVAKIEGSLDFLLAAGFENKRLPFNDADEDFIVFNPENIDLEYLKSLEDALTNASRIEIELDRDVQVLLPAQAVVRDKLPLEFYSLTPEEIKREQQSRSERLENSLHLKTKAMREKEEQREAKKYKYSVIRIRFPDGILLQGTFSVYEKFDAVREFVAENLEFCGTFELASALGHQLTENDDNLTLFELRLVPATMLTFIWNESKPMKHYIKQELMALVQ